MRRDGQPRTHESSEGTEQGSSGSSSRTPTIRPEPGEIQEEETASTNAFGASQQSNTVSQSSNPVVSATDDSNNSARRLHLESLISNYRDGRNTRIETVTAILNELRREPSLTAEEQETTFRLYSAEIEASEARSGRRNPSFRNSRDPLPKSTPDTGKDNPEQKSKPSKQTRTFDLISDPSDSSGSSSDSESDGPKKKPRITQSNMPWHGRGKPRTVQNDDRSMRKTVKLLQLFNKDVKKVKFLISIAPGAPENIPPSQWERIFKGESIDLDQILSSLHRVTVTEERKAHIGETDVLLGPAEATRKVSTPSDWSTAWRRASRAIAFVFPHRQSEIEDYAEYIENEFAAKDAAEHHRIILYDIAVRNFVRGGQHVLLTHYNRFFSLYSAIVLPGGVQYASRGNPRIQVRGKGEICNRFNDKGCSSTSCKYRHACKTCGKSGHGTPNCSTATKN